MFPSKKCPKVKIGHEEREVGWENVLLLMQFFFFNLNIPKWIPIFGVHGILRMS